MIVLKQPEKAIVSIIVVNSLPTENIHNKLDELRKISDLIFVFGNIDIDYEKFTSLYQGCGYVVRDKETIVERLKFTLEYCLEIFKSHASYLLCPDIELLGYNEIDFESLRSVCFAGLNLPIMIDRRLSNEEFKKIYTPRYGWLGNLVENDYGKYSSHTTISSMILFKPSMIVTLLDLSVGIIKTFSNNPSHWIASIIERNGIEHINQNPWSNEIIQTKREK